ncbi:alpha/beta fold hydrolase [Saccharomonospora xinjiangensis]|uniref:alpha/beta fold hydrolase n=1 Tax=Saccharomonospora xinjiangensis TaxID=75294 RepID=UPI0035104358
MTTRPQPESRSIYRTGEGRNTVARWCRERLAAWPLEHRHQEFTIDGAGTHVVTAGRGDRTVVVVFGTNTCVAAQYPLIAALSRRCRVVAADLPGQPGLSSDDRPPAADRLTWYGRWLEQVIDTATHGPVTVLGHSLGAAVALACPAGRVEHQVLVSPAGLVSLRVTPGVALAAAGWMIRRSDSGSLRLLRRMHAPGNRPRAELVEWLTLVARHVRSSADPGLLPAPARLVRRTVAVGARDVFLPPRRLRPPVRRALGAELRVVHGAGHFVTDERPDEIAALAHG